MVGLTEDLQETNTATHEMISVIRSSSLASNGGNSEGV
jgi:hypothetical protein